MLEIITLVKFYILNTLRLLIAIGLGGQLFAQTPTTEKLVKRTRVGTLDNRLNNDSLKTNSRNLSKNTDAKIQDYLIITKERDTTFLDTTLTIAKEYKFNYLRQDDFELLPFGNMGQTYNTLSFNVNPYRLMPRFGAKAKHFNYMEVEDISYYRVPTPLTELMYKSAFEQGQVLDAFFTVNTSKQFNFSVAYKGMRSLGKYQHAISSTGNFRFTTNYQTKDKRYNMRAHIVMQDLFNEENGGISDEDLVNFENGDKEFTDRSLFDPRFENAENNLEGRRFYLDHDYALSSKDSLSNHHITIGNILSFEDKYYQFDQASSNTFFGESFLTSNLVDKVTLEDFYAQLQINYDHKTLGKFMTSVGYTNYNYGYNRVIILDNQTVGNRILGDVITLGGTYNNRIGGFEFKGDFGINLQGDFEGNFVRVCATYSLNDQFKITSALAMNSKAPDFNFQLYQSDYLDYNWQNNFNNETFNKLSFGLSSDSYGSLELSYMTIKNHLYFKGNTSFTVIPYQYDGTINYLKAKFSNEFELGNFALNNTILYQSVMDGETVLNLPQVVTRNTLYYRNHFFQKALYLQTGFNFSYFSTYNMNAYNPLLGEFYIQNDKEFGAFPRIDFFINAKIRQTRIFFKAEHLNSSFTGYDFYSAPNYPYRDFALRFGIVWNFFL